MKKYITILMASLMMLLPSLSYSHHYDRDRVMNYFIHNKIWESNVFGGGLQIPVYPQNDTTRQPKIIQQIRVKTIVDSYGLNTGVNQFGVGVDSISVKLKFTVTFTDGTVAYTVIDGGNTPVFDGIGVPGEVYFDISTGHFTVPGNNGSQSLEQYWTQLGINYTRPHIYLTITIPAITHPTSPSIRIGYGPAGDPASASYGLDLFLVN